jgi:TolB-like protein/thioredoxin-like negative regulator of GroEL
LPATVAPRPRVVVAFFENNSNDPGSEWLGRGLPEMLTTDLSRTGELDVIATQRLYDLLAAAGRDPEEVLDRSTASELARWAGADIVISGAVFRLGERYRIDAQAYDIASGTVSVAHKVEGDELFAMVDELTAGLRRGLQVGGKGPVPGQLQRVTTSSAEAFRDYTRGKAFYDRLEFERAEELFEDALAADPDFALARLRLSMTLLALDRPQAAAETIEEARSQLARMPDADARLTRALWSYLVQGDYEQAADHLAGLTEAHPQHDDAKVLWARALHDLAGQPVEATRKLREVLARDPGNLAAITVLADQMAGLGATEAARALLEDARRGNPQADEPLRRRIEALEDG